MSEEFSSASIRRCVDEVAEDGAVRFSGKVCLESVGADEVREGALGRLEARVCLPQGEESEEEAVR